MSTLKYRFIAEFSDLELVSAVSIKPDGDKRKPKIQLSFATALRLGQGTKARTIPRLLAREIEVYWKSKISPDFFQKLRSIGLKKGSVCTIRAAIDNWGSQESGGAWFEILELVTIDGRQLSIGSSESQSDSDAFSDDLDGLEHEINSELGEFAA